MADTKICKILPGMAKFPEIVDGTIDIIQFIEASSYLVTLVERLGKVFTPVKYDMQGNINKINNCHKTLGKQCLLELMAAEVSTGQLKAAEGLLWLNRALMFFEITFLQVIEHIRLNNYNIGMTKILTLAYEGSIKKYHTWATQQLFSLICKMCTNLPQMIHAIGENNDIETVLNSLIIFTQSMTPVRIKIDEYFKINKVFVKEK